jgi:hypothetical protein
LLILVILLSGLVQGCRSSGKILKIDLLGTSHTFQLDNKDRVRSAVEISSDDKSVSISIDKGTRFVDTNGNPVYSIQCVIEPNLPQPLANTQLMGLVYSFGPVGVICDPPIILTMTYEPNELPPQLTEEDIAITSYEYFSCECGHAVWIYYGANSIQVNKKNHTVRAYIDTLDNYVLLAAEEGMVLFSEIDTLK